MLTRCPSPIAAAASDDSVMTESLAALERHNIWAVTSGSLEMVSRWQAAGRERIIPALSFATDGGAPSTEEFRRLFAAGKFAVFAEVGAQYRGLKRRRRLLRLLLRPGRGVGHPGRRPPRPRTIDVAIKTIEEAPFLSEEQKRDIFYNNAARFLRLSKEEIARHHGG